ncbi:unnamed protein product, partial [Rotaria socialis]
TGTCIEEGIFRYNILQNHQKSVGYDIAVCSEDANAVIKKVSYNSTTNKFSGFPISLKHGIPCSRQFETDSFDELKSCFENKDKTYYLNVHMVKPLIASNPYSSPLLLVAYGINNNFKAIDVLNRWIWMFENARQSNVRIVAFATDCDPRYLLAMRLATDSIHLCTKLRNRILSKKASMLIGKEEVSIEVLMELIEKKSKLAHGLVKTDIEPKDRQNFSSCIKLSSDDVFTTLEDIENSQATRIYLHLLRCIVLAYVEHDTSIINRIYYSWYAVFLCRIWKSWLDIIDEKDILGYNVENKKDSFITSPAHFSIELNAHSLLAICLLVHRHHMPNSALLISNYNSQPCEATFRLTRSMLGAFSSVLNFTTNQFLKRADKISILTKLENKSESDQSDCSLTFLKHHKRRRKAISLNNLTSSIDINLLTYNQIKTTIHQAFDDAYKTLSKVDINAALENKKITTINKVNDENSSEDDEEEDLSSISASGKYRFDGMRVINSVSPALSDSYFSVDIDGKKYIFTSKPLAGF